MRDTLTVLLGKTVRVLARIRGGGSALPGLIVERIAPGFMGRALQRLPHGVVVVSGTNGKTSTTKMITELFEAQGLRVFTNKTGSNFSRGVISAMLAECRVTGRLDADIAVLELDEAHAMHFIERVKPRASLLLNVFIDQVERFSDVSVTTALLQRIADATTGLVVLNADDPHVSAIATQGRTVHRFGLGAKLGHLFPHEDQTTNGTPQREIVESDTGEEHTQVRLVQLAGATATFVIEGVTHEAELSLVGAHNFVNAAAALALVRGVLIDSGRYVADSVLVDSLTSVTPAFGRGETVMIRGDNVQLMMVKNAAGLRLSLLGADPEAATMVAINNQVSDGADVSWFGSVDLSALRPTVDTVSGSQAHYAAGLLERSGIGVQHTDTDLPVAFTGFLERTEGRSKQIFASYTAIMQLRETIASSATLDDVWG